MHSGNVDGFVKYLDRLSDKYWATLVLLQSRYRLKVYETEEQKKKGKKRRIQVADKNKIARSLQTCYSPPFNILLGNSSKCRCINVWREFISLS